MIYETLEEIDFAIIKAIQSKPGINAVGIGEKAHVSRYTALVHTKKLKGLGYIEHKQEGGHTYKNYLAPGVDLDELENARLQQDRNFLSDVMTEQKQGKDTLQYWRARLLGVSRKLRETLILLAKHKEVTAQDLADTSSNQISYQAASCRLKRLRELGLVQRKHHLDEREYLYFLTPPLTKEIIEESLLGIISDSSEEDDEITSEDTPLFSDEEAVLTNENARVHQLFDNNHESLDVNTTKQEANDYSQNGTSDRQPLVSLDLPPSNVPNLDAAYDVEDEIELLYGVIKAQQSEIESSKAEIESLKQRMAAIEELMGQSDRKRDSDRITQLQAQEKIDRRSKRMQSIKSLAPASISLPSEQMINSNGKG
jgi:DNA-binding MarR family transcriptional regulator